MRAWLGAHAHSATSFGAMLVIALLLGSTIDAGSMVGPRQSQIRGEPIDIPPFQFDKDRDTYNDTFDRFEGDGHVRVSIEALDAGAILPYLVIGTQDDHWRFGEGRELEWRHIVDPDPLGYRIGSSGWVDHVIRTGAWWRSLPMEDASKAMAPSGRIDASTLDAPGWEGVHWPQVFHVNIREDADVVTLDLELFDASTSPDRRVATWAIEVDIKNEVWRHGDTETALENSTTLVVDGTEITMRTGVHTGIDRAVKTVLAQRWSPEIRFDSEERFLPVPGEVMERFHGFSRNAPADADLRTWTREFNNGRDSYVLLLADFNGDRRVDHHDAAIMADVLGVATPPTVYANVMQATGDRIVIQYWSIYMYNFVEDETGSGVPALAHKGDREFIQLVFNDLEAAHNGAPASIAYSQHYRGVVIKDPTLDDTLFIDGTHPLVYPAKGSHASYPAPGDDRRLRVALAGYGDRFDGRGDVWSPGNYTVELFDQQSWAYGHLWGPPTRHSRDLGTATRPLLQHGFDYPFIDPIHWQERLRVLEQDRLEELYGSET